LIAPFGPGSIYTDRHGVPHVVCGLDHWYKRWDPASGLVSCDAPEEFILFEPRLVELLRVQSLRMPPDFRAVRRGSSPPPNAGLYTPALRFPRWYRHSKTGQLKRFNLSTQRIERAPEGGRWLPVRFVAACRAGHLTEFPWKQWIGCQCPGDGELILTDRGGSELSSVRIECRSCPEGSPGRTGKSLSGTTTIPANEAAGDTSAFADAGIPCPGERPWLGEGAREACTFNLIGALINQTNLYHPITMSSLLLPDLTLTDSEAIRIRNAIDAMPQLAGTAKFLWQIHRERAAMDMMRGDLAEHGLEPSEETLRTALESLFSGSGSTAAPSNGPSSPELPLLSFRRSEFNIIREKLDDPVRVPDLRVIPSAVPTALESWFCRVNRVERLRETRAFFGFTRLGVQIDPLDGMPDRALHQLFRDPPESPMQRWLPAVRVFGEGLYLELREEALATWQEENEEWIRGRVNEAFIRRLCGQQQVLPPLGVADWRWASRYLLVHTLAHILIDQLVFECGYSTASLRERLYVSNDQTAPMAGLLVYTAAGDSEGTLGGLVRLGHPERFGAVLQRARRAAWCSADPVCSENLGGQGAQLANLAACHACALLPETSCETINHGLDRAMLVGTPDKREPGAFAEFVNGFAVALG